MCHRPAGVCDGDRLESRGRCSRRSVRWQYIDCHATPAQPAGDVNSPTVRTTYSEISGKFNEPERTVNNATALTAHSKQINSRYISQRLWMLGPHGATQMSLLLFFWSPPLYQHKAWKLKLSKVLIVTTAVSHTEKTAFPFWKAMDKRWNRNVVSLMSSVMEVIRLCQINGYMVPYTSCLHGKWVEDVSAGQFGILVNLNMYCLMSCTLLGNCCAAYVGLRICVWNCQISGQWVFVCRWTMAGQWSHLGVRCHLVLDSLVLFAGIW